MECISAVFASPCRFDGSYMKFNSLSMMGSAPTSLSFSSSVSLRLKDAPTLKGTQKQAVAAVATEAASTVDSSSVPSAPLKKVLVPIGYGTEEMEAVILVHVLRQAGAHVTVASVEPQLEVEGSGSLKLVADVSINSCADKIFDLIALPGGMPGSVRLRDCEVLRQITSKHAENKRLYGAICAAPAVTLLPWGLLRRKRTTCHPAFMDKLSTFWAVKSNVQVSGELTTSRGPGTAFEFALSLVEQLYSDSVAQEVRDSLLLSTEDNHSKEEFNQVEWSLDHPPHALIPIANGSNEIEIVTIADILRRAKVNVVVASVEKSLQISASQGTKIVADKSLVVAAESIYDLIILPGGVNGAEKLNKSRVLKKLLKEQESAGRIYGALCSSTELLQRQGLLKDRKITAHPSIIEKLKCEAIDGAKVVIDGKLITSKGLASSMAFALAIVRKCFGHARARSVAEGLVLEYPRN